MTTFAAVVALAALGATARAFLGDHLNGLRLGGPEDPLDLPWGTFAANVSASLLLGVLSASERDGAMALGLAVGGFGALSTWSTFTVETLELARSGRQRSAAFYLALTLVAAVAAAWIGLRLG